MASNLIAMASNLLAMAFNLLAMASNLIAMVSLTNKIHIPLDIGLIGIDQLMISDARERIKGGILRR